MKPARSFISFLTTCAPLVLSGCASWTKPITTRENPTGSESYFYGTFTIDTPKAWLGFDGYQTMGFVFSCDDGGKYTIRFEADHSIQVIKLNPATCSLTEIIYTDADGVVLDRKPAPLGIIDSATLAPGSAYYIGDYSAVSKNTAGFNSTHITWEMKEATNNYESTTTAMKKTYPNMTFVPTRNQLIDQHAWRRPAKPEKAPTYTHPLR